MMRLFRHFFLFFFVLVRAIILEIILVTRMITDGDQDDHPNDRDGSGNYHPNRMQQPACTIASSLLNPMSYHHSIQVASLCRRPSSGQKASAFDRAPIDPLTGPLLLGIIFWNSREEFLLVHFGTEHGYFPSQGCAQNYYQPGVRLSNPLSHRYIVSSAGQLY